MPRSAAARALGRRCEPRVNELTRRMARESFEALPGYAELPDDVKDLEIAGTARHGIRLFLSRTGDPNPGPANLRLFRERAAQRAEEGMPLHLLLRTHSVGAYVLWRALRETAQHLETLRTHLAHQQDRRATATALGLHQNTVDNRLAKIGDQTGIDLASPRGAALAIAALLLRDTQETRAGGPSTRP
ncbi:helix-turn-helix domain-containing protein [Streptomyces sp. NPDC058246]|uniref:helix-turn-helix domain-containing protein n=1 Tax=Streptomyces sp. NPDC058246 TaxID=3346400 RepID=UPI0036EC11AC